MAGVRVDVIKSSLKNSEEVLGSAALDKWQTHGDQIGEIFIEICTPLVPKRSGDLINTGKVIASSKEGIYVGWQGTRRNFDYARAQYYNTEYNHPIQGTDHWDQAAMAQEGDVFVARCERELK